MPIKTVKCVLCGDTVPKRGTLSLRALGDKKTGRACKGHPEVVELAGKKSMRERARYERKQTERDILQAADMLIRITNGVMMVRVMGFICGTGPLELHYQALLNSGFSVDEVERVRAQVHEKGCEPLSGREQLFAQQIAAAMDRKEAVCRT